MADLNLESYSSMNESPVAVLESGSNDDGVAGGGQKQEENPQQRDLPHDLLTHHILPSLPIKSLISFRSVSKTWYSAIFSYQFASTHFKLSSISGSSPSNQHIFIQSGDDYYLFSYDNNDYDYDDDEDEDGVIESISNKGLVKLCIDFDVGKDEIFLVGSCNGLVCLASMASYFIIWNPTINHWRKFSEPYLLINSSTKFWASWGFGYVSSVDDYKVVRVVELPETLEIVVHVFSLRTNKWRRIDNVLYQHILSLTMNSCSFVMIDSHRYPCSFYSNRGVLVNERLYWMVSKKEGQGLKLVAFDLVLEKFEAFPHLVPRSGEVYGDDFLCVLGGCLSMCGSNMRGDAYINILKQPGEVETIRLFRDLHLSAYRNLIGFTRTGKFFIQRDDRELGLVDPSLSPMKYTSILRFDWKCKTRISSYVQSLISPLTITDLVVR